MSAKKPLLVIAAGGTGGHMFPAQALAEAMINKGWRVTLSTDERGARYAGGFPSEVKVELVKSATPSRGGIIGKIMAPFRIAGGVLVNIGRFIFTRPAVVIGFGGYPTIPALSAAWLLRCPRMVHEQNAILGRVNRAFSSYVDVVACGMWPTDVPRGAKAVHTGNPVRQTIMKRAASPYIAPGDYPMLILVIGGSQGARTLGEVVPKAIGLLPEAVRERLRIVQQARPEDLERVIAAYDVIGVRADVEPFINEIPSLLSEAQLIISRAGASSISEISLVGRPAIFVPYAAAAADHQSKNAQILVNSGAAFLISESDLSATLLAQQIADILLYPDVAEKMVAASLLQAQPDATIRLAGLVETLAQGKGYEL